MESTGHYQTNLFSYLKALGYKVGIINPIQTDSVRKQHIRKTKNDKIDAFLVAKTAQINGTTDSHVNPLELDDLKKLTRFRQSYVFKNSQLKVPHHEVKLLIRKWRSSKNSLSLLQLLKTPTDTLI